MKKISISMLLALSIGMLAMGCKKEPENAEGPVEAAGEEAAADISEATEEAGEATSDAVEDATD